MWLSLHTSAPRQSPHPASHTTVSRLMPTGLISERASGFHPCVLAAGCGAGVPLNHEALSSFLETRCSGWAWSWDWGQWRRWELCLVSPVTVAGAVDLSFPDSAMSFAFLPVQGPETMSVSLIYPLVPYPIITFLPLLFSRVGNLCCFLNKTSLITIISFLKRGN